MAIKVGINGFGRIGRLVFRAAVSQPEKFEVVGINDPFIDLDYMVYMVKYDTIHGKFEGSIEAKDGKLVVNGRASPSMPRRTRPTLSGASAARTTLWSLPACSAPPRRPALTSPPAQRRLSSPPPRRIRTPHLVWWRQPGQVQQGHEGCFNASCTTNCLAPLAKVINDKFGIVEGLMTTVHSTTATQKTVGSPSAKDWRGGRCCRQHHPLFHRRRQGLRPGYPGSEGAS